MAKKKKVPPPSLDANAVGYCQPPKHSRFKDGECGNMKGRPSKAKGMVGLLKSELAEKISVRVGTRTKRMSKVEIFVRKLVHKLVDSVDIRAFRIIMEIAPEAIRQPAGEALQHMIKDQPRPNDDAILAWYNAAIIEEYEVRRRTPTERSIDRPPDPVDAP